MLDHPVEINQTQYMTNPCKNCFKRKLRCHSECPEFKEFQKHRELIRQARAKEMIIMGFEVDNAHRIEREKRK